MSFANYLKKAVERDFKPTPEEFIKLRYKLENAWDRYTTSFEDTSDFKERGLYVPIRRDKACNQCGVTAVYVQRHYGGELYQGTVNNNPHYFNVIDGQVLDFTWRQFPAGTEITNIHSIKEEVILANDWFIERYQNLENKLK